MGTDLVVLELGNPSVSVPSNKDLTFHKNYDSKTFVYLEDAFLESENIVKLLGILIDKELTFEDHIRSLLKKANQKFHALMRASKYMSQDKLRILLKAFIESQFNYCPLIWMCHSKKMHNKINKLHERALRVVYKDKNLTFEDLLEKDQAFTIHERNLQKLAVEVKTTIKRLNKHILTPKYRIAGDV